MNAGVEVTLLSAIMGHRDIKTTMRCYVRQKSADLHRAIETLDTAANVENADGGNVSSG